MCRKMGVTVVVLIFLWSLLGGFYGDRDAQALLGSEPDSSSEMGSLDTAQPATDNLSILFSWNTRSALEPCSCPSNPSGGVSRRAFIIENERTYNPNLLVLDLGKIVGKKDRLSKLEVYKNLEILGALGYAAIGVCLSDLRFGRIFWEEVRHRSPLPFLSANLVYRGEEGSLFKSFIVEHVGNLKIGIIGITGRSGFISAAMDSIICSDWVLLDPFETVRDVIEFIEQEVDLIIVISNLSGQANKSLIERVERIDLLMSSAANDAFRDIWGEDVERRFGPPELHLKIGGTHLYNASVLGHGGARLGRICLKIDRNRSITEASSEVIEIDESIPNDEMIDANLSEFHKQTGAMLGTR